ncbi:MAG TPA: tol-pal system protein YbgF [Caulobacteraceae bacterium]|jgi:tol-pal system protein YbgF|nr:tol-pal system protein YbgF [Caulobacteraceae bacterium]
MKLRHALVLAFSTTALTLAAATAFAQAEAGDAPRPDQGRSDDRIDRIEKQLREVREIVLQARSTGQPVEIKEAGPDPQVTALAAKFDDMGQTLQSLNSEVESLTHDDQQAHRDADAAKAEVAALADRVDKLEKQVASLATAPPPPPAADNGQAPAAEASPPPGGGDPKAAYASARKLMMDGDYPAAASAYQDYLDHYPKDSSAPEARYWLGETKYAQGDVAGAAIAYIAAIHGWPQTAWGADAAVKLSLSMLALNKPVQACAALADFGRHYARASAAEKARAEAAKVKAKCGT